MAASADLNKEACKAICQSFESNKESFKAKNLSAFIIGGTGETGKELVKHLARSKVFQRVVLIGRRNVEYTDPDLMELVRNSRGFSIG